MLNNINGSGYFKNNVNYIDNSEGEQIEKLKFTSNDYQYNDKESTPLTIISLSKYLIDIGIPATLLTAFHLKNIQQSISNINLESRKVNSERNYPYCILNCLSISSSAGALTSLYIRLIDINPDLLIPITSINKFSYLLRMPLTLYLANKQINVINSASNDVCDTKDMIEIIMSSKSSSTTYLRIFKVLIKIKEAKYSLKFQLLSLIAMIVGFPTLSFISTIWPQLNKNKQIQLLPKQYTFIFKALLRMNEVQMKAAILSLGEINISNNCTGFHPNKNEKNFLTKVITSCLSSNQEIEVALSCINSTYNCQQYQIPNEIHDPEFKDFLSIMVNDTDIRSNKVNAMYDKLIYPLLEGFSLITILREDMRARQNRTF